MGSRNPSSIPLRNMPLETQIIIVEKIDFLTPKQTVCCSLSPLERERGKERERERESKRESKREIGLLFAAMDVRTKVGQAKEGI